MPQFEGYLRRSYRRDNANRRWQVLVSAAGLNDELRRELLGLLPRHD